MIPRNRLNGLFQARTKSTTSTDEVKVLQLLPPRVMTTCVLCPPPVAQRSPIRTAAIAMATETTKRLLLRGNHVIQSISVAAKP